MGGGNAAHARAANLWPTRPDGHYPRRFRRSSDTYRLPSPSPFSASQSVSLVVPVGGSSDVSRPSMRPTTSSRVSAMSRISRPTSPVEERPARAGVCCEGAIFGRPLRRQAGEAGPQRRRCPARQRRPQRSRSESRPPPPGPQRLHLLYRSPAHRVSPADHMVKSSNLVDFPAIPWPVKNEPMADTSTASSPPLRSSLSA